MKMQANRQSSENSRAILNKKFRLVIKLVLTLCVLSECLFRSSSLHAQDPDSFLTAEDLKAVNLYSELQSRAFPGT